MKKALVLGIVALVATCASLSAIARQQESVSAVGRHQASSAPIGFIGDSITARAPGGQTPATVAAALLGTTAVTRAVSGTTTAYWLPGHAPLQQAIAAFHAQRVRVVHIMLGTNDGGWARISAARYAANLWAIAMALRRAGFRVVVSDSPYVVPGGMQGRFDATADSNLLAYRSRIAALARAHLIMQGDIAAYATFQAEPDLLADGVHPNVGGVRVLGALWAAALAPALQQWS